MSKGDSVEVVTRAGEATLLTASRNGRRLEVKKSATWLTVTEVTRNGVPTGNQIEAPLKEVAMVTTRKVER